MAALGSGGRGDGAGISTVGAGVAVIGAAGAVAPGAAATIGIAASVGGAGGGAEAVFGDCGLGLGSGVPALVVAIAGGGPSLGTVTGSAGPGERASAETGCGGGPGGIAAAGPSWGVASGEGPRSVVAGAGVGGSKFLGSAVDMAMSAGADRGGRLTISDAPTNNPDRNTIVMEKIRTAIRPNRPTGTELVSGGRTPPSLRAQSDDLALAPNPATSRPFAAKS